MNKKDMRDASRFRELVGIVQIYRQRTLRHPHTIPSGDEYVLGEAIDKLTTGTRSENSVLKDLAIKTECGYALPPRKRR